MFWRCQPTKKAKYFEIYGRIFCFFEAMIWSHKNLVLPFCGFVDALMKTRKTPKFMKFSHKSEIFFGSIAPPPLEGVVRLPHILWETMNGPIPWQLFEQYKFFVKNNNASIEVKHELWQIFSFFCWIISSNINLLILKSANTWVVRVVNFVNPWKFKQNWVLHFLLGKKISQPLFLVVA